MSTTTTPPAAAKPATGTTPVDLAAGEPTTLQIDKVKAESLDGISNSLKIASEIFVPGASDIAVGNVGSGVATFLATGALVAALAPASPLLAVLAGVGLRANSLNHSIKGSYLWAR